MHHSFSLLVPESCRQGGGIASYIFFVMNLQARSACAVSPGQTGHRAHATFDVCRTQMLKSPLQPGLSRGTKGISPTHGDILLRANCAARQHRAAVGETPIACPSMVSPSVKAMVNVCR